MEYKVHHFSFVVGMTDFTRYLEMVKTGPTIYAGIRIDGLRVRVPHRNIMSSQKHIRFSEELRCQN